MDLNQSTTRNGRPVQFFEPVSKTGFELNFLNFKIIKIKLIFKKSIKNLNKEFEVNSQ
jgi:hypothetical protein